MEYVITFKNTNLVIKGEQVLLKRKIEVAVMPLPSQIRAGCGLCLRILPEQIDTVLKELNNNEIAYTGIYRKKHENDRSVFHEICREDI